MNKRVKDKLDATAKKFNIEFVEGGFKGECSRQEVKRLQDLAKEMKCDCTVGSAGNAHDQTDQNHIYNGDNQKQFPVEFDPGSVFDFGHI